MSVRATPRGAQRTPLSGDAAACDVLVCGASFAGLAVARALAGTGADVLVVDRYELGERQTSACAAPTAWLEAMGVREALRSELPAMTFTTPHGSVRAELGWSWSSFDYRTLCRELWAQAGPTARMEAAKVEGRADDGAGGHLVRTDRGTLRARLVVDALGWRRVLDDRGFQPPDAPLSRGLEVHPDVALPEASGDALDCWIDRSLARRGYGWRVPAGAEERIGVGSYDPRRHVKEPTRDLAGRLDADAVRYQGNWFPHELRPATSHGVAFVGDSAGHCLPASGEGIRTAFHFGTRLGEELAAVLAGERDRDAALARYHAFSAAHAPFFARVGLLQRLLPDVPPRLLTTLLGVLRSRRVSHRAFGWYLAQVPPPAH